MQEPREQDRRENDSGRPAAKKSAPVGGNMLWIIIAVAVLASLSLMWSNMEGEYDIPYMKFVSLLKDMAKEEDRNKRKEVKVTVYHEKTKKAYRIWDPSDLNVSQNEITGKIKRQAVNPQADDIVQDQTFRVSRIGFRPGENNQLEELLSAAGLTPASTSWLCHGLRAPFNSGCQRCYSWRLSSL